MRPIRVADLTTFMHQLSRNLGASTSWIPQGLSRPVQGLLYLFYTVCVVEYLLRLFCLTANFNNYEGQTQLNSSAQLKTAKKTDSAWTK